MDNPAIIALIIVVIIILIIITVLKKLSNSNTKNNNQNTKSYDYTTPKKYEPKKIEKPVEVINKPEPIQKYRIKQKYISNCELDFYKEIKSILNGKYIIYPQVPLSRIIEKTNDDKYINELFRIIDFCIFDYQMKPLVCIEINDRSHHRKDRYIRDQKVKDILANAELPLITLWTEFGINHKYIKSKLQEHLELQSKNTASFQSAGKTTR